MFAQARASTPAAGAAAVDKQTKKEMDTQVRHPTCVELLDIL